MKKIFCIAMSMQVILLAQSQEKNVLPLYGQTIPNSRPVANIESSTIDNGHHLIIGHVTVPTLTVYLPPADKATGAAVIICPGGGYTVLAARHEGSDVAEAFNKIGVAAFVLKYRIPDTATMIDRTIGPLQDAQRAIQLVRMHAGEWHIDPKRVGILGFSAGGHLASTAGTHFDKAVIDNPDHTSLRPDFMILVYPVISFSDSIGHLGSRNNLLGKSPSPEKIKEYSNELQVTPNTPPTFLVHAKDDDAVMVQNSINFYQALKKNNVPADIYLFEKGGHGFGLIDNASDVKWMDLAGQWLNTQGLSKPKK